MKSPFLRLCLLPLGLAAALLAGGCSMGFPLVPPMHPLMLIERTPALESPALPEAPRAVALTDANPVTQPKQIGSIEADPILQQLMASPVAEALPENETPADPSGPAAFQAVSLRFDWGR